MLAVLSFGTVLVVGLWRHGFHFFSLFVPHGTPWWLLWLIPLIELFSFLIRPFSLALRLFVAMTAGHVLMKVLAGFVINGLNAEAAVGCAYRQPAFVHPDDRHHLARTAGVRDSGLCLCPFDLALHQRRGQSSLSFFNPI